MKMREGFMERVSCWRHRYLHKSYFAVIPADTVLSA
jgi:hypothetical protein